MLKKKKIIFLHIPKTGGMSFNFILDKMYKHKKMFHINYANQDDFLNLPEKKRNYFDVILGHHSFGIHKHLNSDFNYITFIRNPLDRIISLYYFIKRRPDNIFYKKITEENITLKEFIQNEDYFKQIFNGQTKQIAGIRPSSENKYLTKETFEKAIQNIDNNFTAVGLTDRFDESILLFKKELNWSYPLYLKQNVTKKNLKHTEINKELKQLITEKNQYDLALYNYAKEKFELTVEKNREFMQTELPKFKRMNKRIKPYLHLNHNIKKNIQKIYNKIK